MDAECPGVDISDLNDACLVGRSVLHHFSPIVEIELVRLHPIVTAVLPDPRIIAIPLLHLACRVPAVLLENDFVVISGLGGGGLCQRQCRQRAE